jgi:catechol 2,3-dioxygenase-like lactoylglutathione lyase family enzyme
MEDCPVDPDLPCLVNGIHHLSIELSAPSRMRDWMEDVFGLDRKRTFHRRGEYWTGIGHSDAETDTIGRTKSLFAIPQRPGIPRVRLHHLAFDIDDTEKAIGIMEERGFEVPITDRIMFGPEGIWFQIDSRKTPYPVGHPTNQPGVRLSGDELMSDELISGVQKS